MYGAKVAEPSSNEIFKLADRLKELRDEKDVLDETLKTVKARISEVDYALASAMALSETQSFTRAGKTFYLTSKLCASAVGGMKDELYSKLKEKEFGSLIYETINANSFNSFVKEQIEENNDKLPKWLDGLVNVYNKVTVNVNAAKSNRK